MHHDRYLSTGRIERVPDRLDGFQFALDGASCAIQLLGNNCGRSILQSQGREYTQVSVACIVQRNE